MKGSIEFKAGDIFVIWGKKFTSGIIAFLEEVISGMKDPPTHIAIAKDESTAISAESDGIKIVPINEMLSHAKRAEAYRYNKFTDIHAKALSSVSKKYLGKGYDYWVYLHWTLQVLFVFVPFLKAFLLPIENWLKEKMRKTFECSEVTTRIWNDIGFTFGVKEAQVTTPVDVYQVVTGCDSYEKLYCEDNGPSKFEVFWRRFGILFYFFVSLIMFGVFLYILQCCL